MAADQEVCAASRFSRVDSDPPLSGPGESRLRRTVLFLGVRRLNPPFCQGVLWVYSVPPSVAVLVEELHLGPPEGVLDYDSSHAPGKVKRNFRPWGLLVANPALAWHFFLASR